MVKRITEILNLLVSVAKARWILLLMGTVFLSGVVWLRGRLLSAVELPLIVVIVMLTLAAYPLLKLLEWLLVRTRRAPISLHGLEWTRSFRFQYPTPLRPRCGREVVYRWETKPLDVVRSVADIEKASSDPRREVAYAAGCALARCGGR